MEKGFEALPKGRLLNQFVDFSLPMGTAYERCIGYDKDYHVHDRANVTFPRGASVITFTVKSPRQSLRVDDSDVLWMPAFVEHRQDAVSTIYDNLALFPTPEAIHSRQVPSVTVKAKRSVLLNELINRFFCERVMKRREAAGLATQIIDESLRLLNKGEEMPLDLTFEPSVDRAIQFIEANLFHDLTTKKLAEYSRSSVATLFRHFREATQMTPFEYIRKRRLDEALHLLKTRNYQVGDVGLLVGYEDLPSFSKAFKKQFHRSPSSFLT